MNKTFFPLLLSAMLATAPAHAFDSSDPFGIGTAQADKPAKAQREVNDGHFLEDLAKNFGTGVGVGAAGGALMGAAVLNPLFIVGGSLVIGTKIQSDRIVSANAFYSGIM